MKNLWIYFLVAVLGVCVTTGAVCLALFVEHPAPLNDGLVGMGILGGVIALAGLFLMWTGDI